MAPLAGGKHKESAAARIAGSGASGACKLHDLHGWDVKRKG